MRTNRKTTQSRRPDPKAGDAVPAQRVQEMLLELAYRLHATKPVASLPRPTGSVA
jgi:hypothetical protein